MLPQKWISTFIILTAILTVTSGHKIPQQTSPTKNSYYPATTKATTTTAATTTADHSSPTRSLMEKAHDLFYSMVYNSEIPGSPGKDYPIFADIPASKFRCSDQGNVGYYADIETGCQVIHICQADGYQESFLCPNGTIFNQQYFVCDWWFNVDCKDSPTYYELNGGFGKPSERNYYQEPTEKVTEKDYFQESKVVEVRH